MKQSACQSLQSHYTTFNTTNYTSNMSTRKEVVWSIRECLFTLFHRDLFELAKNLATEDGDTVQFSEGDKEGCMDYVTSYLQSQTLLQLEDEGMSQMLTLDDLISQVIQTSGPIIQRATPNLPSPHPSDMLPDPSTTDNQLDSQTKTNANTETESVEELRKAYETLGERIRLCETIAPRSYSYTRSSKFFTTVSRETSHPQRPCLSVSKRIQSKLANWRQHF